MSESKKNLLRWIAVIPGSLLAGFLSTFPLHWLLYLAYARNGTLLGFIELPPGSNVSIEHFIYPCIIALVFVYTGSEIAPKHKFKTAVVLSVLYLLFMVSSLFWATRSGLEISLSIRTIGPVVGLLLGLLIVFRKLKENKL